MFVAVDDETKAVVDADDGLEVFKNINATLNVGVLKCFAKKTRTKCYNNKNKFKLKKNIPQTTTHYQKTSILSSSVEATKYYVIV